MTNPITNYRVTIKYTKKSGKKKWSVEFFDPINVGQFIGAHVSDFECKSYKVTKLDKPSA